MSVRQGISFSGYSFNYSSASGGLVFEQNPQTIQNIASTAIQLSAVTRFDVNASIAGVCCGGVSFTSPVILPNNVELNNNNVNTIFYSTLTGSNANSKFEQAPFSVVVFSTDVEPMPVGIYEASATLSRTVYNYFTGARVKPMSYYELNLFVGSGTVASITGNTTVLGDLKMTSNVVTSVIGASTRLEVQGEIKEFSGSLGSIVLTPGSELHLKGSINTLAGLTLGLGSWVRYTGALNQQIMPNTVYDNLEIAVGSVKSVVGANLSITGSLLMNGAILATNTYFIHLDQLPVAGSAFGSTNTGYSLMSPIQEWDC